MILTVDIGNSNITMGVYRENDLLFVARLATDRSRTGDQYAVELKSIFALYDVVPKDFEGAIISSCARPRRWSRAMCRFSLGRA